MPDMVLINNIKFQEIYFYFILQYPPVFVNTSYFILYLLIRDESWYTFNQRNKVVDAKAHR
jgi:hypothetical protein